MSAEVDAQIAKLEEMAGGDLRAFWHRLTRQPVPRISPKLLRLALAWELQARAYGGFDRETVRQLAQLDRGQTMTSTPRGGTRLVREWQGKVMW